MGMAHHESVSNELFPFAVLTSRTKQQAAYGAGHGIQLTGRGTPLKPERFEIEHR